ncbi:MAG: helix-turn-helix transcriptional regulator, partial [Naasia sp.]|nr:helix-turn-helix transcriptional regulator [Naasia sp.]
MRTDGAGIAIPENAPGAEELHSGGVLLTGASATDLAAALERLLADSPDAVTLAVPSVAVPLGAFLPLLDGSGSGFAPPTVLVAGRVRSLLHGTGVLAVADVHELDPASAGLLLGLTDTGVRLLLTAPTGARLPAAVDLLVADGAVSVVELPDGAAGASPSAFRTALRDVPTDARRVAELVVLAGRLERGLVDLLGAGSALPTLTAARLILEAPDGSLRPAGRGAADAVRA